MSSIELQLEDAWLKVTGSRFGHLKLTDLMSLFDVLENNNGRKLLSNEYRDFLVEFIVECPSMEIDMAQFRSLMERLFECSLGDVLNGSLYDTSVNNKRGDTYRDMNIDEDITQTMNLEREKFNSFLRNDSLAERERVLRERINNLTSMINNRNRDDRTISKMKDVLINYYAKLDEIVSSQVKTTTGVTIAADNGQRNAVIERLKANVDKQDVIIKELKRKFGDEDDHSGILGFLQFKLALMYRFLWKFIKYPFYAMIALLIVNFITIVFLEDYTEEQIDFPNETYWG